MGCGSSTEAAAAPEAGGAVAAAAAAPAAAPKKAAAPAAAPKKAAAAPAAAEPSADGIERNAGGCEEPHSDDPELWNIDGTEMDLNAKYKMGAQLWYLQDRMKDAIQSQTKPKKKQEPKELIEEFLTRFRPKATPKLDELKPQAPAAPQKPGAEHFTTSSGETPPVTPPRKMQGPPGLESREYPNLIPKVPLSTRKRQLPRMTAR